MDIVREACSILKGELALMIGQLHRSHQSTITRLVEASTHHRIRESRRYSYHHPPYYAQKKFFAFASDQAAYEFSIKLRNIQTEQCSYHEKHAMTDDQAELLTLPSRDDNPQ